MVELHSPYTDIALQSIQKAIQKRESMDKSKEMLQLPKIMGDVINNIDNQMQENLGVYHSGEYDVDVPVSHYSLNKAAEGAFNAPFLSNEKREVRFILISFGFQPYPTPQFGGDWAYNDGFASLGKVVAGKKVDFYIVGLPYGMGGKESQKMKEARKKEGFEPYGKIVAKIIQQAVPAEEIQKGNTQIHITGQSMSTQSAERGYNHLPEEYQKISYALKDNPVADRRMGGIQVPVGFLVEGALGQLNPTIRAMDKGQKKYSERLKKYLDIPDTEEQQKLRSEGQMIDIRNMTHGFPLEHHNSHLKTRQGILDPTSITPTRISREVLRLIKGKPTPYSEDGAYRQEIHDERMGIKNRMKTFNFPIKTTHSINRFRAEKWIDRTLYVLRELNKIPKA